jgi:hypothetical protein
MSKLTIAVVVVSVALGAAARANKGSVWRFDGDADGASPAGFSFGRTGKGAAGHWVVQRVDKAPSGGYVLVQDDADKTAERFPVAVADDTTLADVALKVKCKAVSGKVDQACGVVLRYQDENNYLVARANALENNVRLYVVVAGKRKQLAGWDGKVTAGAWHELKVEAKGDRCLVSWDGQKVIDARDKTLLGAGKVGVWTKADSVTWFDDLTVEPR